MSFEQAVVQLEQTNAALQEEVIRFRDAAMGLNAIYPTITEGRQAVSDGKYFSVPGGGAYMRLYRRQGSSAQLIAEFPDRAELNSVIDQLGPLLGRGVVGGPGDLMAQGAFGWGVAPEQGTADFGDDLNTVVPRTGLWSINGGYLNAPAGNGVLFQLANAASSTSIRIHQVFFRTNDQSVEERYRTHQRYYLPGVGWTPWHFVYNSQNILGTVSQSGGVPTGAVIERGSNANGEYVKFADGTMICTSVNRTVTATTQRGSVFWGEEVSFSFPAIFSELPLVFTYCTSTVNGWGGGSLGENTSSYRMRLFCAISLSSVSGKVMAIGRWY